jgi:hypothetical protein
LRRVFSHCGVRKSTPLADPASAGTSSDLRALTAVFFERVLLEGIFEKPDKHTNPSHRRRPVFRKSFGIKDFWIPAFAGMTIIVILSYQFLPPFVFSIAFVVTVLICTCYVRGM